MRKLGKYICITFAISWALMGIMIYANWFEILKYSSIGGTMVVALVAFCPAIVSYIVFDDCGKGSGKLGRFCQYIFKNAFCIKTWIILAVIFVVHLLTGYFCGISTGIPVYMCIPYLPIMVVGGGLEEIGWRGFLQPTMEQKMQPVIATILVGIIWAFWHTPMWFIIGSGQQNLNYALFYLFCIWLSFMLNVILKTTKSVFACILFHAWSNVVANLYSNMVFGSRILAIIYLIEILICIFVITKSEQLKRT